MCVCVCSMYSRRTNGANYRGNRENSHGMAIAEPRGTSERGKRAAEKRAKEKAREREGEESSATEVESTRCRDFIWCSAGRNPRRLFSSPPRPFFLPSPCLFFALSFTLPSRGRRVHNAAALITPYMHNKDKKLGVSNSDARHARRLPNRVIHGAPNDPTQVATSEITLRPAPLSACPLSRLITRE